MCLYTQTSGQEKYYYDLFSNFHSQAVSPRHTIFFFPEQWCDDDDESALKRTKLYAEAKGNLIKWFSKLIYWGGSTEAKQKEQSYGAS